MRHLSGVFREGRRHGLRFCNLALRAFCLLAFVTNAPAPAQAQQIHRGGLPAPAEVFGVEP